MTNHFFVIDPQGVAHTRSSKGRTYTHTVVFKRGALKQAGDLVFAQRSTMQDSLVTQDTYASWAQGKWGTLSAHERQDAARGREVSAYLQEQGVKHMAQFATAEAYEAYKLAHRLENHAKLVAQGYYDTYANAGWCGRADLARKLANQQSGDVLILEAQVGKPPKAPKVKEAA